MATDNAVARLHAILSRGKALPANKPCADTWGELLGVSPRRSAEFMHALGVVMSLPQQAVQQLERAFPDQMGAHSQWVAEIQGAFYAQKIAGHWESFISHITPSTLNILQVTATLLSTSEPVRVIPAEQLSSMREKVEALLQEVLSAEIDVDLKRYLIQLLQRLHQALTEYQLSGGHMFVDLLEQAAGHAISDRNFRSALASQDSISRRVFDVLAVAANAVTVVSGGPALLSDGRHLLELVRSIAQ